jgi:hypothetical protein
MWLSRRRTPGAPLSNVSVPGLAGVSIEPVSITVKRILQKMQKIANTSAKEPNISRESTGNIAKCAKLSGQNRFSLMPSNPLSPA